VTEAEVVAAFTAWLADQGWEVETEVDVADVVARRDGVTLVAEAKGTTAATGLDIDTGYGQLLRRMRPPGDPTSRRYALVVPTSARQAAERVHPGIRDLMLIELYLVAPDGTVPEV
jgi:hypothetical protein